MRSVTTALRVLEAVAVNQPIGLSALTRTLGLPKTTVQRSLATLAESGWIEQQASTGRWQVGVRTFVVGSAVAARGGLRPAALPTMRDLGAEVGETVHLMVPAGRDVVLVERVDSPQPVRAVAPLGARGPLHATSNGKAVLAALPQDEVKAYIEGGLQAVTPHTITDPERLRTELDGINEAGFAVCQEEVEEGVVSVGAAIRPGHGRPVASLSISGPKSRMSPELLMSYGEKVRLAAEAIAVALPVNADLT
ncbi:IclR family transcriptional regulator [Streptomyces griseorubiginosus]|uniref:IclR family transcriptional regulator n=1 Tax=Streptomyces griseorubiginosus TaxID=67304 RepID=UPI001AD79862|nr:IclR family transcriptional regulator [Streptomyces griseorubiginosus]MBO4252325.1 helix-turn-helix domain-containing protein [Streptomyces griseorubiginosus]